MTVSATSEDSLIEMGSYKRYTATPVVIVLGFTLAILCIIVSCFTLYKLYKRTVFEKNRFQIVMWTIVIFGWITSGMFFVEAILLTVNVPHFGKYASVMWNLGYVLMLAIFLNAVNKYSIVRKLHHWHYNITPMLYIFGVVLFVAIISCSFLKYRDILRCLTFTNLIIIYILDGGTEMILLKKLYHTRSQVLDIPKNIENAYYFTKKSIIIYTVAIPVAVIFLYSSNATGNNDIFHMCKYITMLLLKIHIYFNVSSMVFIKDLGSVCPSSPTSPKSNNTSPV